MKEIIEILFATGCLFVMALALTLAIRNILSFTDEVKESPKPKRKVKSNANTSSSLEDEMIHWEIGDMIILGGYFIFKSSETNDTFRCSTGYIKGINSSREILLCKEDNDGREFFRILDVSNIKKNSSHEIRKNKLEEDEYMSDSKEYMEQLRKLKEK